MRYFLLLLFIFISFCGFAQKQVRLNFTDFQTELKYKNFTKPPEALDYEVLIKKVILKEEKIKKPEYFTPFRKELPNPYQKTIHAKQYKNTAKPLKFSKKRIENTEIINESTFLLFKENAELNIKYQDMAHGFFANQFTASAQTNDSVMWLASADNGLGKYTGSGIEILIELSGLPSNRINALFCDSQNRLWIGTSNGFCYIENNAIYLPEPQINERIWAFAETSNNEIWVGSLSNGVWKIANDSLFRINDNFVTGKQIEAFLTDKKGNLWIGTDNFSLTRYDGKSYTHYKFYENENEDACLKIHENKQGLWFGFFGKPLINLQNEVFSEFHYCDGNETRVFGIADNQMGMWLSDFLRGIFLVDFEKNRVQSFEKNKTLDGQSHFTLFADFNQNIWSSSLYKGVFRIDNQLFSLGEYNFNQILFRKLIAHHNQLWYLPSAGFPIKREGDKLSVFSHSTIQVKGELLYPFDLLFLNKNTAWIASFGLGPCYFDQKNFYYYRFPAGKYVTAVSSFDNKKIWFATNNAGLIYYTDSTFFAIDESNGLSNNQTVTILNTAPNEIWAGTQNHGINLIKDNQIAHLTTQNGLAGNQINHLFRDTKNRIWVATSNGINVISGNKMATITATDGLISNVIRGISQDSEGNLWVATDKGISKLEPTGNNSFKIINYNNTSGRFMNDFSSTVTAFPNGKMAWNTPYGLVSYHSEHETSAINKPVLNLNGISIDEVKLENVSWQNEIIIEPNKNLKVDFTALDWGNEQNLRYWYALEKTDVEEPKWIALGKAHIVHLTEIPQGKYKLWMKAENLNNSVEKTLALQFLPPWWLTWWAKILWLVLFIGIIVLFFLYRIKILQKQKQKLEEQVMQRTEEIMLQKTEIELKNKELSKLDKFKQSTISMLVHDLKNPLSLILNSSTNRQVQQATYSMLNIVMNILDINKEKTANLQINKESKNAAEILDRSIARTNFLREQKNIRLQTNYQHTHFISVDEELTIRIFENVLTNAIKYSENNSTIYINTFTHDSFTCIEVKDEGVGIDKEMQTVIFEEFKQIDSKKSGNVRSTGLGLAFCKMAAEKQGGKIEVQSQPNSGSSFFVFLENAVEKENTENIQLSTTKKDFSLTSQEKKIIAEVVAELKQTEIYEITNILNALSEIANKTKNITEWIDKVKTATMTANRSLFEKLLNDAIHIG